MFIQVEYHRLSELKYEITEANFYKNLSDHKGQSTESEKPLSGHETTK